MTEVVPYSGITATGAGYTGAAPVAASSGQSVGAVVTDANPSGSSPQAVAPYTGITTSGAGFTGSAAVTPSSAASQSLGAAIGAAVASAIASAIASPGSTTSDADVDSGMIASEDSGYGNVLTGGGFGSDADFAEGEPGQTGSFLARDGTTSPPYVGPTLSGHSRGFVDLGSTYDSPDLPDSTVWEWVEAESDDLPADWSPLPAWNDEDLHNRRVIAVVNKALRESAEQPGNEVKADILYRALRRVIDLREDPSHQRSSESLILRDAERYLWGRQFGYQYSEMYRDDHFDQQGLDDRARVAPVVYDALKLFTRPVSATQGEGGQAPWQASPKKQSALGGWNWYYLGLRDFRTFDVGRMRDHARPVLLESAPSP